MSKIMSDAFKDAWTKTGRAEGGYVDNPDDSGGKTNHGITERVARNHGFIGRMRDLTAENARQIAKSAYWDVMKLDSVDAVSHDIAKELFDTGFNTGPEQAAIFLQRSLNALNRGGKDYPDVLVDGDLGGKTLHALRAYLSGRWGHGEEVMLKALNSLQGAFYIELVERRAKDETFLFGWLKHRVQI